MRTDTAQVTGAEKVWPFDLEVGDRVMCVDEAMRSFHGCDWAGRVVALADHGFKLRSTPELKGRFVRTIEATWPYSMRGSFRKVLAEFDGHMVLEEEHDER